MEFETEKLYLGEIPLRVVHPVHESRHCVIFYHGWSSDAVSQESRAALLAAYGWHVLLPEAVNHGERGVLPDYYTPEIYETFWKTIFQNADECAAVLSYAKSCGFLAPWIMGHSMGGMTTMQIAYRYAKEIAGAVCFNGSADWLLTHLFMQAAYGKDLGRDCPFYDEIEKRNPLVHMEEMLEIPILMTNGEADTTIDPRAMTHFAEEFFKRGGRGKRVTYPALSHVVTTNMLDEAIAFMKEFEDGKKLTDV